MALRSSPCSISSSTSPTTALRNPTEDMSKNIWCLHVSQLVIRQSFELIKGGIEHSSSHVIAPYYMQSTQHYLLHASLHIMTSGVPQGVNTAFLHVQERCLIDSLVDKVSTPTLLEYTRS